MQRPTFQQKDFPTHLDLQVRRTLNPQVLLTSKWNRNLETEMTDTPVETYVLTGTYVLEENPILNKLDME